MLLPCPPVRAEDDDEDPRARLVRQVLDYERIRAGAAAIGALPRMGREHFAAEAEICLPEAGLPEVTCADLQQAWLVLGSRRHLRAHHRAARRELSVRETMGRMLERLQGDLFAELGELVRAAGGSGASPAAQWVVHLLAMLELAREGQVEIVQDRPFEPIRLRLAGGVRNAA